MADKRIITCTNNDGFSMSFTETQFDPFLIHDVEGVYLLDNTVNITENTMTDGAVYQGSITKYRNIVLTLKDMDNFAENRTLIDKLFKRNSTGRLLFEESDNVKAIEYVVENVDSTGEEAPRFTTISLICPDPFFYDPNDVKVYLAQMVADFEFIHEFKEEGEEFGHSMGLYENIYNESANENIGLSIVITGEATIVNPVIARLESSEFIQIGTETNQFTLTPGEQLVITTGMGNKHVLWIHDGQTEEINYMMADGSSFIQLMRGDNNISYDAEEGKGGMSIEIAYRLQYPRA